MRRVLVFTLVAATAVALLWWRSGPDHVPTGRPSTSASAAPSATSASHATSEPAQALPSPKLVPSSGALAGRDLAGRELAVAWLRGYLTRSSRDDGRWKDAIADLSSPELVAELAEAGPDSVGLDRLTSWKVTKVEAYEAVDLPVDTPSRRILAYAATVIDGQSTVEKPFVLYSYRQPDNRWLVTGVDQPYSSEG